MAECVIFVGLPASGKTTFYQQRFAATHRHISKDHWPSASNKEARQAALISAALSEGASIVIDNTNPSVRERAPVIALARAHGARIVGYHFTATTREAVGRNRGREGKQRVPDVAIFTKAKHMVSPTRGEGFDELYAVAIRDDGTFDVHVHEDEAGGPPEYDTPSGGPDHSRKFRKRRTGSSGGGARD